MVGDGSRLAALALACLTLTAARVPQRESREASPGPGAIVPAPAETYTVELWLDVQYGPRESARPAPHVQVEIGIQDSSRASEPGDLPLELHRPVLARATSGERGELRLSVPVPLEWRRRSAFLWVRVETPGHARSVQHFNPRVKAERERLRVFAGGTLLGRVRDEQGNPLPGATLSLLRESGGELVGGYAGSRSCSDGSFAVHFYEPGRHGIHARHASLGSSPRRELELDPARVPEPVELVLRGGPAVGGRLLDPLGEPVAGAWITFVPPGMAPAPRPADLFEGEGQGGLLGGKARIRADGGFELPALLAGVYDVHLSWLGEALAESSSTQLGAHELGEPIGRVTVAAGERELLLRHAAHRLEVLAREADGTPVVPGRDRRGRLELPALSLTALGDEREYPRPSFLDDRIVFAVRPGGEYLLRWQEETVPLLERRLTIDPQPYRVELPLALGPRGAPATLAVRVTDPSGAPFASPILSIVSLATGAPVAGSVEGGLPPMNTAFDSAWSTTLPPGRYRVRASSESLSGCVIPEVLPRVPFRPAERELELAAGATETLELRLEPAGHLDLVARRPGPGPGAREAEVFRPRPGWIDAEHARRVLGGATLALVDGERRLVLEAFEVEGLYDLSLAWLLPGWPARGLDPIPPGDWTLRAERGGELLFEERIRINSGEVTRVAW